MDPHVVEILVAVASGLLAIAVYVTIYHELVATLPFLGVENFVHTHRLQAGLSVNCAIHYSYILTFFVENNALLLALSIIGLLYTFGMLVAVNAMYFSIWRHHNTMRKMELRCYVGNSSRSWDEILRKWRVYVIILSLFLLGFLAWLLYGLLHPSHDTLARNSYNFVLDPNEPPFVSSVILPVGLLGLTCGAATRSTTRPSVNGQAPADRRSNTKSTSAGRVISTSSRAGRVVSMSPSAGEMVATSHSAHSDTPQCP